MLKYILFTSLVILLISCSNDEPRVTSITDNGMGYLIKVIAGHEYIELDNRSIIDLVEPRTKHKINCKKCNDGI